MGLKEFFQKHFYNKGDNPILTKYFKLFAIAITIIFVINLILFYNNHFYTSDDDMNKPKTDKFVDAAYFTTTQISTIGFGDFSPRTNISKIIASFAHLAIIILTYNVISEFTPLRKQEVSVDETKKITESEMTHKIEKKYFIPHNLPNNRKIEEYQKVINILDKEGNNDFGNVDYLYLINQVAKMKQALNINDEEMLYLIENKYKIPHDIAEWAKVQRYKQIIKEIEQKNEDITNNTDYKFLINQIDKIQSKSSEITPDALRLTPIRQLARSLTMKKKE